MIASWLAGVRRMELSAAVIGIVLAAGDAQRVIGADPASPVPSPATSASHGALAGPDAAADNWPAWRGTAGRAVALHAQLPDPWPSRAPAPQWEARIGAGWSSPIVAEGRVFVTDRLGGSERLAAWSSEHGKLLWELTRPVEFEPHAVGRQHGNGPKSTPVYADGRVFAVGIAGWLVAADAATGQRLWEHVFPAEFADTLPLPNGRSFVQGTEHVVVPISATEGGPVPLFGYTGSPIIHEGRLVTAVGGARGGTVMAFDVATGAEIWRALDENVSYSSPVVARLAGIEQVVIMTGPRVVGLSLAEGKLLWSHPFQISYDESISTPAVAEQQGLVLVTADQRPLTALRIEAGPSPTECTCEVAWKNEDLTSYLSSMVVHGNAVYGMNDGGQFGCIELMSGRTLWSDGDGGYYASAIVAGDRLFALNEQGELNVVAARTDGFRLLGRTRLAAGASWTVPAIVGRSLYVRSDGRLARFDW